MATTHPGLARAVEMLGAPRMALGTFPTAVDRVDVGESALWVKRDDVCAEPYGGGKVRKLEYLLAEARRLGKKKILTVGAVGSHHVLATTIFGRRHGFEVAAVVVPQPRSAHAVLNARADLAQGARVIPASYVTSPLRLWRAMDDETYVVPLGGSNALGALGHVAAALELAAQVERGELAAPDRVYVALGSGGTAAGLAVGFALAGLPSRVVGVAVSTPVFLLGILARRLARSVARACEVDVEAALSRIEVDGRWVGRGYGHATDTGTHAIELGRKVGVVLDEIYTAKAFAAALARAQASPDERILFWHTLSSRPMTSLVDGADDDLPPASARLLR